MTKLPRRGLTLIELLVTISIIGVVFGVIISSAGIIQKYGRDAKRQSDLRSLQSALQQYYADQNFFPDDSSSTPFKLSGVGAVTSLTSSIGNPIPPPSAKTYLNNIPSDPTLGTGTPYFYKAYASLSDQATDCDNSTTKCFYYILCAKLENIAAGTYCGGSYNLQITPN